MDAIQKKNKQLMKHNANDQRLHQMKKDILHEGEEYSEEEEDEEEDEEDPDKFTDVHKKIINSWKNEMQKIVS